MNARPVPWTSHAARPLRTVPPKRHSHRGHDQRPHGAPFSSAAARQSSVSRDRRARGAVEGGTARARAAARVPWPPRGAGLRAHPRTHQVCHHASGTCHGHWCHGWPTWAERQASHAPPHYDRHLRQTNHQQLARRCRMPHQREQGAGRPASRQGSRRAGGGGRVETSSAARPRALARRYAACAARSPPPQRPWGQAATSWPATAQTTLGAARWVGYQICVPPVPTAAGCSGSVQTTRVCSATTDFDRQAEKLTSCAPSPPTSPGQTRTSDRGRRRRPYDEQSRPSWHCYSD